MADDEGIDQPFVKSVQNLLITEWRISVREIALCFWAFEAVEFKIYAFESGSIAKYGPRCFGESYQFLRAFLAIFH
jgi:hypothetical protein